MMNQMPSVIQGGMGVSISGWQLARAVAIEKGLGVVSGTAIEVVVARQLQLGDADGSWRRAFKAFPFLEMADRFLDRYFIPGGKLPGAAFRPFPMHRLPASRELEAMTVVASFAAIFLAKEEHAGPIGLNLLCKIPLPTLAALYGAMLAGVDVVIMGAGIPRTIPGILDLLSAGLCAELKLEVDDAHLDDSFAAKFDPVAFCGGAAPSLKRPKFFAVVSSSTLALALTRKANGRVDGFVVEYPEAGGHNAPPRGGTRLGPSGEPIYGERDRPDLTQIANLGLPFWLAGGFGAPGKLTEARALGAQGIQVGTAFAFCEESGMDPAIRQEIVSRARRGEIEVFTDPAASPTGFPFKVVRSPGEQSLDRCRVCDLGYLRQYYRRKDGSLGYRCPGEATAIFVRKGGEFAETQGRVCVCNGLLATAGLAQRRAHTGGGSEPLLITSGDSLGEISLFVGSGSSYSALDVLRILRSDAGLQKRKNLKTCLGLDRGN